MLERMRRYGLLLARAGADRQPRVRAAREHYLRDLARALPMTAAVAVVAAEISTLLPDPPTPPHRSHRQSESRHHRLVRWHFDCIIAATALVTRMRLVHNNPRDFETVRLMVETVPQRFPDLGPLELIRCTRL